MYSPKDIIDLIADNVKKTKNPFGIPKSMINNWWKTSAVCREGDTLLYTGLMYQFGPYIETATRTMEKYEDSLWADYVRYARYVPNYMMGLGLASLTPIKEKRRFNVILQNIAKILMKSNVDFFYKPELDDYSGVLLYDLGDQDGFVQHANYVATKLKQNNVHKLITVDPHTTYALKVLFPKYTGEHFDVKTYFELINFKSGNGGGQVTLHDPCFYGRYLELSDVPAKVLSSMNIECLTVRNAGQYTHCCGGPAESVSPKLSGEIADRRLEELKSTEAPVITMCPICLGNLQRAGADVEDLSDVLARWAV